MRVKILLQDNMPIILVVKHSKTLMELRQVLLQIMTTIIHNLINKLNLENRFNQPTQPTQNAPKLDLQYDIIEDLKKTRANISMYDLLQIYPMPNSHVINPAMSSTIPNTKQNVAANSSKDDSTATDKGKATTDKASLIGKNSKSTTSILTYL